MATGFGEINVMSTDLDSALRFYRDTLGLPELEREAGAVRLGLGPITLLVLPFAESASDADGYPGRATISFDVVVEDVDAMVDALEAVGGRRIDVIDDGAGWAVADPDGNIIEVIGG